MLRSMYSGISGMKNFQTKLGVIGNNIANVNTYGFKKGRTTFKDLVSQQIAGASSPQANRGGINPKQIGLGSALGTVDTIHTQGSIQTTGRLLDLAISGDGFFIANKGNAQYYTRAGNFYLDSHGNLVTADGYKVQGYGVNSDGTIDDSKLTNLKINSGDFMEPTVTSNITLEGNLDAATAEDDTVTLKMTAIDSLGFELPLEIVFTKGDDANEWTYDITTLDGTDIDSGGSGTINFNPATGKLDSSKIEEIDLGNLDSGAEDIDNLEIDLSALTQTNAGNTVAVDTRNGNFEGYLESFNVGASGEITGVFTNGEVKLLGQIAIANFSNVGGLNKAGGNLYQASNNSGIPNIGLAGDGRGTLVAGSLEMSNVDLSVAFTEMITAQRGFQANTRIITTSDEILQELVNLKR